MRGTLQSAVRLEPHEIRRELQETTCVIVSQIHADGEVIQTPVVRAVMVAIRMADVFCPSRAADRYNLPEDSS